MFKKFIVLQEDKHDCAAASLLSIIKYYNGNMDLETVRELINTTKDGTNAYDLINGAREIGLEGKGKKLDFINLTKETNLPLIAHIKKDNMYHFVVIYKIDTKKGKITVMDPIVGIVTKSFKEFKDNYLGVVIELKKVKELPNIKQNNKILKITLKTLLKNKTLLIKLSLLSLFSFVFSLTDYLIIKILLDKFVTNHIIYLKYILIFLSFIVLKNTLYFLRNRLSIKINHKLENEINKITLSNIFILPYCYYKNKSTGEVISRIYDLHTLSDLLENFLLNTFVNILLIIISFIIMFKVNKYLTLINIIIILLYLIIVKIFRNNFKTKIKELQEKRGYYNQILTESINNIESINNLNIKEIETSKLNNTYQLLNNLEKSLNNTFNLEHLFKNLVSDIGMVVYLIVASVLVLHNKLALTEVIVLYMLSNYFISIIKSLLDKDLDIYLTLQNISRVNSLFTKTKKETNSTKTINGSIEINNLSYSYGSEKVLNNINLTIKEKDKILLTGKSGSGKSTLVKIILKYLTKYNGLIKINNTNLKNIDDKTIINSMTYIGQNEQLFTGLLKDNIILNRKITEYEYNKILNICCLNEVIDNKSFKDDTLIEQDGFNLSGGERQRIILARGLLKPANYIILDEALSEVDIILENKIITNILENYKDKTIIYISHKDEIKNNFNVIYNVERRKYE